MEIPWVLDAVQGRTITLDLATVGDLTVPDDNVNDTWCQRLGGRYREAQPTQRAVAAGQRDPEASLTRRDRLLVSRCWLGRLPSATGLRVPEPERENGRHCSERVSIAIASTLSAPNASCLRAVVVEALVVVGGKKEVLAAPVAQFTRSECQVANSVEAAQEGLAQLIACQFLAEAERQETLAVLLEEVGGVVVEVFQLGFVKCVCRLQQEMAVVVEPAGAPTEALVLLMGDVVGTWAKRVQVEDEPLAHDRDPLPCNFLDGGGRRSGELGCDPSVVDFGMCAFLVYDLAEQVAAHGLG